VRGEKGAREGAKQMKRLIFSKNLPREDRRGIKISDPCRLGGGESRGNGEGGGGEMYCFSWIKTVEFD